MGHDILLGSGVNSPLYNMEYLLSLLASVHAAP